MEIFLLSLRVSFFSVKVLLLLVLKLSVKNSLTVFRNFPLSVSIFMFTFPRNVFLVGFSKLKQILCCRLKCWQLSGDLFLLNAFHSLDHFMITLRSGTLIKTRYLCRIFFFFIVTYSF